MRNETRFGQIQSIVNQLAALPGGMGVDVEAKNYPRSAAPQMTSGFCITRCSFEVGQLPQALDIPENTDKVIIQLHGSLPEPRTKSELVDELNAFFFQNGLCKNWDIRTRFRNGGALPASYEVTIFTHEMETSSTPVSMGID